MPEYLSPGVYVEEFESGPRPMEGVSTSTAGFIGLTEKGDVEGVPILVTNFSDFSRNFGGYLSENGYREFRYLSYAVENFFTNGGSRCYVMRVGQPGAKNSSLVLNLEGETKSKSDEKEKKADSKAVEEKNNVFEIMAKNPGKWGDKIKIRILPTSKSKSIVKKNGKEENTYELERVQGFNAGDIIMFYEDKEGSKREYKKIESVKGNIITVDSPLEAEAINEKPFEPTKFLYTCEFSIQVSYNDEQFEFYDNLSVNKGQYNFINNAFDKSNLIKAILYNDDSEVIQHPFKYITSLDAYNDNNKPENYIESLKDGDNGTIDEKALIANFLGVDKGPGKRTGIKSFIDNEEVSILAAPGITAPEVQSVLIAHCENQKSRFVIIDAKRDEKTVPDLEKRRNLFDSSYAALYSPWIQVFDPLEKRDIFIPPSGSVAGIYSRVDTSRGVHKAPANEVIQGCTGLDCQYNKGEQDILNPKGVNLIRSFVGQGIRVWGGRTCSSNSLWKYINVRRLFIFIEESIKRNTNWVVFEPNDEKLWDRVRGTITNFLTTVWRSGALFGSSAAEAFYVKVDKSTMTQDDIDNGRLICEMGVAPVKPAEFVIFRITQKAGGGK